METHVVILFVGLTLWSQQIPNDCGVKAILPRVEHTTHAGSAHGLATSPSPVSLLPVQKHRAAIVFPRYSFRSQNGWGAPTELPEQNLTDESEKLLFVPLDGDSLRFDTNGAANVPANLTGMRLARVQEQLCPAKNTLRAEFQPPHYSGAAAVVALPEGTLQACLSVPAESLGRLDTRVAMKTIDTLRIFGGTMSNQKELCLQPRSAGQPIQLMIVNVPESFFEGTPPAPEADGVSHMNVYLDMAEPGGSACTVSLRQWWDQLDPDGIPLCSPAASLSARGALTVPDVMLRVGTSGANFECSNTQWP
jgi:hypothetical protein